jgi:hypothetical protein
MRAHQVSGGGKWPPPRRVSTACPQRGMRHWQRWGVTPARYRPKGGHPAASLPAGEDRTGARKCRRAGSVVPMTHRNDGCDGGRAPTPPGLLWRGRRPGEGADQARSCATGADTGSPASSGHPPRSQLTDGRQGKPDAVSAWRPSGSPVRGGAVLSGKGRTQEAQAGSRKTAGTTRTCRVSPARSGGQVAESPKRNGC